MKLLQAEEIESQRQVKMLEINNPEVLLEIKEYKDQSDLLTASLLVTDGAIKAQGSIADENAGTVDELLTTAVNTIVKLFVRATTKAISAKDKALQKKLEKPFTYFYANNKETCLQKLDAAVALLVTNKLIITNIDATDITDINTKINLYRVHKNVPRTEEVTKKSEGTDLLTLSVNEGKKIKKLMIKLVVGEYKDSNPTLADKARLLGKTIQLGKRHNVGSYSVVNASTGEPIGNAVITEVRTTTKKKKVITKVFKLDELGIKEFTTHILGKAVLTVVAPGFLDSTMNIVFKKNDPNEFVIGMSKVVPK